MSTGRPLRATAVLLASLTAVFGVALAGPAAAQTAPDQDAAPAAAGWLARQLVDGNHFEADYGGTTYPDQGLTADAVLAFAAADVAQDYAVAATEWLAQAANIVGYAGNGDTDSYVGPLAKLALVAITQGGDPRSFGADGVDLIDRLQARRADSGRFSDLSSYVPPPGETNDFSNGITQSLAIISLLRAGGSGADLKKPADFLASSRCDDGGFPLQFDPEPCASDVDTTAFAIQALLAAGRDAAAALDYLEDVQADGGGFGGSGPTSGLNANSTGLAAQALRVGGRTEAADDAVMYLLGLQVGCDAPADQHGAIAYDAKGFEASTAARATAQALYGLTGVGLVDVGNDGDAAGAPTPECAPPSTTAPSTTTQPPPAQGSSGAAELPATGVRAGSVAAFGVLLVLAGAGALLLSRPRRGIAPGGERP